MARQWHTVWMRNAANDRTLPTILLIDDDMVSREVMATVLTMSGYPVHAAEDGPASLALLAAGEFAPGLILMDTQMPGLSGMPLVAELRSRTHACIFAISASDPPPELFAACDGYLRKPFLNDELKTLLENYNAGRMPSPASDSGEKAAAQKILPSSDPQTAAPVIKAQTLAELRQLMPETAVRQIYAALAADLTRRHAALQSALAAGDKAELRRIGHTIKGGCEMAGALQASRLGAAIESGAFEDEVNQLDNGSQILRDLRAAVANLERMLDSEFQT
jgi:CheY-like chemotaxis protein